MDLVIAFTPNGTGFFFIFADVHPPCGKEDNRIRSWSLQGRVWYWIIIGFMDVVKSRGRVGLRDQNTS